MLNLNKWPYYEEDEIRAASNVLNSGKVNYWTGNENINFEREFSEYCGVKYAIAMANGSLALSGCYASLELEKDSEIITTPRTFIATASTAVILGYRIIFADVDINSGCITAETILPKITKKTRAISVVHLGGWPARMQEICDLAKAYNLFVIEDCSQAHGAKIDHKSVGSFGDVSSWSFCQEKIISTGGEGGMITTNNKQIYDYIWSYKDHGKNYLKVFSKNKDTGFRWLHDSFGTNMRLTEFQSSIGRIQLSKLENWNKLRARNANILYDFLKNISCVRIPEVTENIRHAWYKYYVYINFDHLSDDWDRSKILNELKKQGAPAFTGSCGEIYLEKSFQTIDNYQNKRLKNARNLAETSLMFLIHHTITEEQMYSYAGLIKKVLKQASI